MSMCTIIPSFLCVPLRQTKKKTLLKYLAMEQNTRKREFMLLLRALMINLHREFKLKFEFVL